MKEFELKYGCEPQSEAGEDLHEGRELTSPSKF